MDQAAPQSGGPSPKRHLVPVVEIAAGACVTFVLAAAALPLLGDPRRPELEAARTQAFQTGRELTQPGRLPDTSAAGLWRGPGEVPTLPEGSLPLAAATPSALQTPDPWGRAWLVVREEGGATWLLSAGVDGRITRWPGASGPRGDDIGSRLR